MTWELPLAVADNLWTTELRREQLPDFVYGGAQSLSSISPGDIAELSPAPGVAVAIWRAPRVANRSPLPQIIVGDRATLDDLFAWSASYMRGIGPLTAQTRVITPAQLRLALRPAPDRMWWQLAGGAVGAVVGEVLMHARRSVPFSEITLAACRGTLTFALMRAAALGILPSELPDVADLWEQLRSQTGQPPSVAPIGAVAQAAIALAQGALKTRPSRSSPNESNQWFISLLDDGGVPDVLYRVVNRFGPLPPEFSLERFFSYTPEERVQVFDKYAPFLVSQAITSRVESAFSIALVAYLCRPGLEQQMALAAGYCDALPEIMVWLGAMQAATPFTDTLAAGDGLGWRLARDLFEPSDVFATPRCDVALQELRVLARGRGAIKIIRPTTGTRLDVELLPGVSSFVRALPTEAPSQPRLELEPQSESVHAPERVSASRELIFDTERAIDALTRFLRNVRLHNPDERPTGRKRRR
jgi:hypothetical protein